MKILRKEINKIIKKYPNIELEEAKSNEGIISLRFYMNGMYYRTLEIKKCQNNNNYNILIKPLNFRKITDFVDVIHVIYSLEKYSQFKDYTEFDIRNIRKKYKEGMTIQIINMYDYIKPVPKGTIGIVDHVDKMGGVHMKWENGSENILLIGIDDFEIIKNI